MSDQSSEYSHIQAVLVDIVLFASKALLKSNAFIDIAVLFDYLSADVWETVLLVILDQFPVSSIIS